MWKGDWNWIRIKWRELEAHELVVARQAAMREDRLRRAHPLECATVSSPGTGKMSFGERIEIEHGKSIDHIL